MQLPRQTVLIFTISQDVSTNKVIRYLGKDTDFLRINNDRKIDFVFSDLTNLDILIDTSIKVDHSCIKKIWFRKGNLFKGTDHKLGIVNFANTREEDAFRDYLIYHLENRFNILGTISADFALNKLIVLAKARGAGL